MQFHKLLADRQAQSEARIGPRCRAVSLGKSVEDMRKITLWNADTGVADAELDVRIDALDQYLYLASLRRELDCVGKQVPHDLLQAGTVGADDVPGRTEDRLQADALGVCRWHGGVHGCLYDTRE